MFNASALGQICRFDRGGFLVHRSLQGVKMNKKSVGIKDAADKLVKNIRRRTSRKYSAEEKICIILAGLRGEASLAALCRLGTRR